MPIYQLKCQAKKEFSIFGGHHHQVFDIIRNYSMHVAVMCGCVNVGHQRKRISYSAGAEGQHPGRPGLRARCYIWLQ